MTDASGSLLGTNPRIVLRGVAGVTLTLDPRRARYVVGRSSTADIRVHDDLSVSREHAEFVLHDGRWYVSDMQSRNGLRVDGRRLTGPVALLDGMTIVCGGAKLEVSWPGQATPRRRSTQPPTVDAGSAPALSDGDRAALAALCLGVDSASAVRMGAQRIPTNEEVANGLELGDDALRQRLKRLYAKFALVGNDTQKRRELVARALETGALDQRR